MSIFDIRNTSPEITEIKFADSDSEDYGATHLEQHGLAGVSIDDCDSGRYIVLKNKAHAANLRKALDKAEELGWLR